MVGRNEAHRYLQASLFHLTNVCDQVFFYDDRSTDNTVGVALDAGCTVSVRKEKDPSFLEHEGRFRQNAFDLLDDAFHPGPGDWILSVDADEIVTPTRSELNGLIAESIAQRTLSVVLSIPEIFSVSEDEQNMLYDPQVRTDGFWNRIRGFRLYEYHSGGTFKNKKMGCGSEPTYVENGPKLKALTYHILHLGYAHPDDRQEKYERYSQTEHGHNNSHIQSIIKPPKLQPWRGRFPEVWRGYHDL